ncbi:MAG: DUF5343 domain-containing protein [Dehalococcoidia bacterium]|nr:DUF5343 domain-containing protein [Dehalococcoidia bacterium]
METEKMPPFLAGHASPDTSSRLEGKKGQTLFQTSRQDEGAGLKVASMLPASSPGKKLPPPYVSHRTFWNFLEGLQQTIPARIDRSYWGTRLSGSNGSQIVAALRFLDLTDANGFPTAKLRQLVSSRDSERAEIVRKIVRDAYGFLAEDAPDPQTTTYAQLEEAFHDNFQLASDVARKCIKFYICLATAGDIKLSPFVVSKTRNGRGGGGASKKAGRKSADKKARTEIPQDIPTNGHGNMLDKLLLEKFPSLDPDWPDELKSKWFTAFNELLRRTGGNGA